MVRTRSSTQEVEVEPEAPPDAPVAAGGGVRGVGRARGRGRGRGRGRRGVQIRTAAQPRARAARATRVVDHDDTEIEDQPEVQVDQGFIATQVLQDTMSKVLGVLQTLAPQGSPATQVASHVGPPAGTQMRGMQTSVQFVTPAMQTPEVVAVGSVPQVAQAGQPGQIMVPEVNQVRLIHFTRLLPPTFGGLPSEDPRAFLDRCQRILAALGYLEEHGVDYTAFQLEGPALIWWNTLTLARQGLPKLSWSEFSQRFMDKFIPRSQQDERRRQFERLRQGHMTVSEYEVRFLDMSHDALDLVRPESEKVRRFIDGLSATLRSTMAREIEAGTSFDVAVDIARRYESYRALEQEEFERDSKRSRGYGGVPTASSGGKGFQGRSSDRPAQSMAHSSRSTFVPRHEQTRFSQPSQPGQSVSRPQQHVPRRPNSGCYHCRELGHHIKDCPRLLQGGSQSFPRPQASVQTYGTTSGSQPARSAPPPGRGRGRGGSGPSRGGHQSTSSAQPQRQFYALPARQDAVASNAVVTDSTPSTSEHRG